MSTPGTSARRVFISVAALLLAAGWSANHFASVLVALREQLNLSPLLVNGALGIYALADGFGGRLVTPATSVPLFFLATVLLGLGYGLCLRDGLLDVNAYSPASHRGRILGAYYVATYVGFALPPLMQVLEPRVGPSLPFAVLTAIAVAAAVLRSWQIRTGYLNRT